jgi:hypothetical protein
MVAESSFPFTLHVNRNERSSDFRFRFGVGMMTSLIDARNSSESIELHPRVNRTIWSEIAAESSFPLTLHVNRNERSSDFRFRFGVGMTSLVDARNTSESIELIRVLIGRFGVKWYPKVVSH